MKYYATNAFWNDGFYLRSTLFTVQKSIYNYLLVSIFYLSHSRLCGGRPQLTQKSLYMGFVDALRCNPEDK